MKRKLTSLAMATILTASMATCAFGAEMADASTGYVAPSSNSTSPTSIGASSSNTTQNAATAAGASAAGTAAQGATGASAPGVAAGTTTAVPSNPADVSSNANINSATNAINNSVNDLTNTANTRNQVNGQNTRNMSPSTSALTNASRTAPTKTRNANAYNNVMGANEMGINENLANALDSNMVVDAQGTTKLDTATYIVQDGENLWIVSGKFKAKLDVLIYSNDTNVGTEQMANSTSQSIIPVLENNN